MACPSPSPTTRALLDAPDYVHRAQKYTSEPFPARGAGRVASVIAITRAGRRTLGFDDNPG